MIFTFYGYFLIDPRLNKINQFFHNTHKQKITKVVTHSFQEIFFQLILNMIRLLTDKKVDKTLIGPGEIN